MFSAESWQIQTVVRKNCSTWWPLEIFNTLKDSLNPLYSLDSFYFSRLGLLSSIWTIMMQRTPPMRLDDKQTNPQLFAYAVDLNMMAPLQHLVQRFRLAINPLVSGLISKGCNPIIIFTLSKGPPISYVFGETSTIKSDV